MESRTGSSSSMMKMVVSQGAITRRNLLRAQGRSPPGIAVFHEDMSGTATSKIRANTYQGFYVWPDTAGLGQGNPTPPSGAAARGTFRAVHRSCLLAMVPSVRYAVTILFPARPEPADSVPINGSPSARLPESSG